MIQTILNFFKGNVSLAITYWIFGVVPALILATMLYMIINPNIETDSSTFFIIFIAFYWFYFPLTFIAIWNSAKKYTGHKLWSHLSKFSVVLGIFVISRGIYGMFDNSPSPILIREQVKLMNKNLPAKMNDLFEITKVSYENNTFSIFLKLINQAYLDINPRDFFNQLKPRLRESTCSNKRQNYRMYLKNGINISFTYQIGNDVRTIVVTPSDCQL